MSARHSFAAYRDLLAKLGFKPSRRLGQNFLLDPSLHRILVDAADPRPGDLILEVGPGLGFLTRELAARARVVAVEIDARLHGIVARELSSYPGGGASVRLLHADALCRSRLHPDLLAVLTQERREHPGRFLLVANLPYAIAGPLLAELVCGSMPPDEMAVLVQLELAQRITAAPGTKEYGALSVQLQLAYRPTILRKVGSQVFRPRPNVDSAMLQLKPRPRCEALTTTAARRDLAIFLRQLFESRRKKLRNAKPMLGRQWPPGLAHLLDLRPDAVAPGDLLSLYLETRMPES